MGIADFRIFPDSYIEIEDDYKKSKYIFEQAGHLSFEEMVRFYWSITPEAPPDLADRFMRRVFVQKKKWENTLAGFESRFGFHGDTSDKKVLEIGCGTGGFLIPAANRYDTVVGIDIAFRWLVMAKKRLQEEETDVPLLCACAEYLPFQAGQFDLIMAEAVIEHVRNQKDTLKECQRVSKDRGRIYVITANRLSLSPEPHVRVWGVGFLPRKWMNTYVSIIKRIPYKNIRLLSFFEFRRLIRKSGFDSYKFLLSPISDEETQGYSPMEKKQVAIYNLIIQIPLIRMLLYLGGPSFHLVCQPKPQNLARRI